MRLAILSSHPIQYYGPLFRTLAQRLDVEVFFAHRATPQQQAQAGFGTAFDWDVDPTQGYKHVFLENIAKRPGVDHFAGCDTPEIGRRLAHGAYDGFLTLGWHLKSSVQGISVARGLGLPILVRGDSHLETPRSPVKRVLKRLTYPTFLRQFSAVLYVGARSRAYYEHYGYPSDRLFSSPHCVDTAWFAERATDAVRRELRSRLGVAPADRLVLFAGKLVPFKRPLDVVEAIARARATGAPAQLLVAGSGELEGAMRARARELAVPSHFLGFQNQSQMPAAYAAADLLMLPSDGRETWGLVCNEALACGTPIAVSASVGCAEDLAAPGVGWTFPLGDMDAAAAAIAAGLAGAESAGIRAMSDAHGLTAAADGVVAALEHVAGLAGRRGQSIRR